MRLRTVIMSIFILMIAIQVSAVKTGSVELGEDGSYDGHVKIQRDASGRMVFTDDTVPAGVTLEELAGDTGDHGGLTGLGADDHPQYLNPARHETEHSVQFNDNLAVSPDVMGNTRLYQHLQNSDMHPSKSLNEEIDGLWTFRYITKFFDTVKFSDYGESGKVDLTFEDGAEDALIRWEPENDRFETNRPLYVPTLQTDESISTVERVVTTLSGSLEGSQPSGIIENFASIEGIEPQNLLDKTANEDISGKWDFLNGIDGIKPSQVVTAGKDHADFTSIQAAIDSITDASESKPYVVLVYPGVYVETNGVQLTKSYISIVGVNKKDCIVERSNSVTTLGYNSGTINLRSPNCSLSNLTIKNTEENDGSKATAAVITSSGDAAIYNCYIGGNGGRDILSVLNTSELICRGVIVEQYRSVSTASHMIWVANSASIDFQYGEVYCGSGGGPQFNTTGNVTFKYSYIDSTGYAFDCAACGTLTLYFMKIDSATFTGTPSYSSLETNFCDNLDVSIGGTLTANQPEFTSPKINSLLLTGNSPVPYYCRYSTGGKWEFSTDLGSSYQTNLYCDTDGVLETDDKFAASGLQDKSLSAGIVKSDTSGNLSSSSLTDSDIPDSVTVGSGGNLSSPPAIGDTTPNTGSFTSVDSGGYSANGSAGISGTRSWEDNQGNVHEVTIEEGIITAWDVY